MGAESRKVKRIDREYPMNIAYELMGAHKWKKYDYEHTVSEEQKEEMKLRLEEVIRKYPEKIQDAFNERWKKNFTWEEAGKNLGITKDLTVFRAQKIMKEIREDENLKQYVFIYDDDAIPNIPIEKATFLKCKKVEEEAIKMHLLNYGITTIGELANAVNGWRQAGDADWCDHIPGFGFKEKHVVELHLRQAELLWNPDTDEEKRRLKNPLRYERACQKEKEIREEIDRKRALKAKIKEMQENGEEVPQEMIDDANSKQKTYNPHKIRMQEERRQRRIKRQMRAAHIKVEDEKPKKDKSHYKKWKKTHDENGKYIGPYNKGGKKNEKTTS